MDLRGLAPQAGFEPATLRLTAGCSAVELLRNMGRTREIVADEPPMVADIAKYGQTAARLFIRLRDRDRATARRRRNASGSRTPRAGAPSRLDERRTG